MIAARENEKISIAQFIQAIQQLPSDKPRVYPGKWYSTQKEHWLGWLSEYHGPGAYGRTGRHDARFAYNHIVEPRMLLWLIGATGVTGSVVAAARIASGTGGTMQERSAAIRRCVPWPALVDARWGSTPRG